MKKIKRELERKKFTVAVVGEFSKGKSTFINKLLGREFLPTGNLPTTAILTKIRYNPKEMIILFDYHGNEKKVMPLSIKSWQGMTADIDGNDPERIKLTEVWLEQRVLSVMDTALASLDEQKLLIQADEKKREKLIAEKKLMLSRASVEWDNLRLEMLKRCSICYKRLLEIIDEHKIKITERLQYEAAHAGNPETWWKEDYPYRLKVEIMNMSSGVESFVTRTINEDLRWLNITLSNQFKTQILFDKGSGPEDIRKPFDNIRFENSIEFEDIAKKRNMVRAGTAALTAASYLVLTPLGLPYLVASLGIGTGSSIITEKVFKGKIENQKAKIKEVIAQNVPEVIDSATMQTKERLNMRYNEIIKSAREKEDSWMAVQSEAIENSVKTVNPKCEEILDSNIADIKSLYSRIQKY